MAVVMAAYVQVCNFAAAYHRLVGDQVHDSLLRCCHPRCEIHKLQTCKWADTALVDLSGTLTCYLTDTFTSPRKYHKASCRHRHL